MAAKSVEDICDLIMSLLSMEPRTIGTKDAVIVGELSIGRYVILDEVQIVATGQVPAEFAKAAEGPSPRLCAAQPRAGILKFQEDAGYFCCRPLARRNVDTGGEDVLEDAA